MPAEGAGRFLISCGRSCYDMLGCSNELKGYEIRSNRGLPIIIMQSIVRIRIDKGREQV